MEKPVSFDISLWERLKEKEIASREAKRIETLKKALDTLKRYFSNNEAKQVFVIGSILQEMSFYNFSDIDIVVEGLKKGYFKTLCELEGLLDRRVDLIEYENCSFKRIIDNIGIRVK